jgi:hypothetical protein
MALNSGHGGYHNRMNYLSMRAEDRAVAASHNRKTLQRKVRAPQDRIPGHQGPVRVQRCNRKKPALFLLRQDRGEK